MATETIRIDGRSYVSHDCWTFGDYGGAGSIGKANIRVILAECKGRVVETPMNTLRHIAEGCPYGLGADELAEIREERPWAIHAYGDYGSEQVWVRKPLALRISSAGFRGKSWIARMDSYPCLSDEESGEVEMEWEMEAWESWLRSDLIRTLPDDGSQEEAAMLPDGTLMQCYRSAMEAENEYPEAEHNGVFVRVERIAGTFADYVREAVSDLYTP